MKLATKGIQRLLYASWAIALGLTGCQTQTTEPEAVKLSVTQASAQPIPPKQSFVIPEEMQASKRWKIAFFGKDGIDPVTGKPRDLYQAQAWIGAKQAADDFGVQVQLVANKCQTCVEDQIRAIARTIDSGEVDGMIIMATDSVRLARVVEKAIEAGIPAIAMDTPVNSERLVTFVVFDNYTAGVRMGEWVVSQLGGRGRVLVLDGALDQQNAIDRRNGFLAGLRQGDIEILDSKSANWKRERAFKTVANWLQQFPQIDAIISANDAMALGASEAAAAAERSDIIITGFDAVTPALKAIQAGKMTATIDQAPSPQARLALQLKIRHLEKEENFPPRVLMPEIPLITKQNVGDYLSGQ